MDNKDKLSILDKLIRQDIISASRFKEEWSFFKQRNGYRSTEDALDNTDDIKKIARETISRYCNGSRRISPELYETFSNLFGVRREYLEGKDDFRTDGDILIFNKKNVNIRDSIRDVLINLGYADLEMNDIEYNNPTFPQNTAYVLRGIKEEFNNLNEPVDCNVIVDVNKDTFISIKDNVYNAFIDDVVDYISFKMSQLFDRCEQAMPTAILDDGSEEGLLAEHPSTTIHLADGSTVTLTKRYVPLPQLSSTVLADTIEMSIEEPEDENNNKEGK